MPRPGYGLEALFLHGLAALDAQAESARLFPAQSRPHQDEQIPRAAALLEQGFLVVATVGLVGHVLGSDDVGLAAVVLDARDSGQQLFFFSQQPLLVGFGRSLGHHLDAASALTSIQSILGIADGDCQQAIRGAFSVGLRRPPGPRTFAASSSVKVLWLRLDRFRASDLFSGRDNHADQGQPV